jgi:hypothetical protein
MIWLGLAVAAIVIIVLFKFVVKPLFKVLGLVILALIAWYIFRGGF